MTKNSSKTAGRFLSLIRWELEKTFTFPTLAIVTAVVFITCLPAYGGGRGSRSRMPSLVVIQSDFAYHLTVGLSYNVLSSFMYSVIIFAALTSSSLSRDMSMGYMRVLLSYPIRRTRLLLSKILVLLFVPFFFFTGSLLFGAALTYPGLFLHMPSSAVAYVSAVMLVQMFFIFAVSLSASLYIRQPIVSFLASTVTLISMQQISTYLAAPYKYLLPTQGTIVLMDYYFDPSTFESQYAPGDVVIPLFGMIIVPVVILIINLIYFKWRFQT